MNTWKRLRSRTVSLFSRDGGGLWRGGGGRGEGGATEERSNGKAKEPGATLPRLECYT